MFFNEKARNPGQVPNAGSAWGRKPPRGMAHSIRRLRGLFLSLDVRNVERKKISVPHVDGGTRLSCRSHRVPARVAGKRRAGPPHACRTVETARATTG